MAAPYSHAHVAHISRMGRRRSQSVTIPNTGPQDNNIRVQSLGRKEFLAQLQKERLKQQIKHDEQDASQDEQQHNEEDHHQPTVSRLAKSSRTMSMRKTATSSAVTVTRVKKELSSTPSKTIHVQEDEEDHHHQPTVVNRLANSSRTMSMRKMAASAGVTVTKVKKEQSATVPKTPHVQEDEPNHTHPVQVTHIPLSESTILFKEPNSTTLVRNGSNVESLKTSSTNLIPKSKLFDQEFFLNDGKDHARRNDIKDHGHIRISKREKYYNAGDEGPYTTSSASFMTAIIGIIIAVIAFAFALTALILVLLLRSTVDSRLGFFSIIATNSTTSSSSSGTLPSACSNYTTLDDPTRNIAAAGYALGCDTTSPFINRTMPVWIRFIGTGGSTLPLATPGMNLCGSEGTGWYDGTMPSSTGEIINGTACFTWYNSVCRFSSSISVANCGSFYIYNLPPPPACMLRYCTI
ncbi:unnamed protein product [Rotaria sp. Silwood1]|nr:unnamed protein product [Rotaria sp. Silwood1]CAF1032422.1 unnamed protein product [Rotaria sp. Silwood1]CAF3424652.1 unnamed protein product [Rotaria sp. Silwood1]